MIVSTSKEIIIVKENWSIISWKIIMFNTIFWRASLYNKIIPNIVQLPMISSHKELVLQLVKIKDWEFRTKNKLINLSVRLVT